MKVLDIIRRSSSCWASPLHMVQKKTLGDWRPCGDYGALNNNTVTDQDSIPHTQDFDSSLGAGHTTAAAAVMVTVT